MGRLSTERYLAARRFLHDRARDLERLQFEHEFEGAPAWPVFDALARFQNDDGGFGHGLEPDALTPHSGALATSVALRALADLDAPTSHPLVAAAVAYLERTLDASTRVWRIVPPGTADSPHAPWWNQEGLDEGFGHFKLNPRPDLLAQLLRLRVNVAWLPELVEDVVAEVESRAVTGFEMHDLMCCVRLMEALSDVPSVPARGEFARLRAVLEPVAVTGVAEAAQSGYGLRALSLAPLPTSVLAEVLAQAVATELDALIVSQADDGAWWPVWSWGEGADEAAWASSSAAWAGVLTLDALRSLAAAGLIDRG